MHPMGMKKFGMALVPLAAAAAITASYCARGRKSLRLRTGQIAIITGGSSGLGLALAHRFGHAGLRLVLAARSMADLEQARQELISSGDVVSEDDILLFAGDLSHPDEAADLIEK